MKTNLLLCLIALVCFTLAACATPAETTAVIATGIGAAGAFIHELSPLLSPELQAKLTAAAGSIDGTVDATRQAVGVIADAIAAFKGTVGAQAAETAKALQASAVAMAELPGREEVYLVGTGSAAGATAASRGLSALKHGRAIAATAAPR